jgi:hypothetical protein
MMLVILASLQNSILINAHDCIIVHYIKLDSAMVPDIGYETAVGTAELAGMEIVEVFLEQGHSSLPEFNAKYVYGSNSNRVLLVYAYPNTIQTAGQYCDKFGFHQVFIMAGRDVDISKSSRGQVMVAMDRTPPRCDTKFTGLVENGLFMKWASARQEFSDKLFDTSYSKPSAIKNPPVHYIYIGQATSRNSYNCDRSYPITNENLALYNKFEDSKIHYNLHGLCPDFKLDFETTFIGQLDTDGKKFFSYVTDDCKMFLAKLAEARVSLKDVKIEKTPIYGWNKIIQKRFGEEDFDMISSYLSLNHGLSLNSEASLLDTANDILWHEKNKPRIKCWGVCRFIDFQPSDNERPKEQPFRNRDFREQQRQNDEEYQDDLDEIRRTSDLAEHIKNQREAVEEKIAAILELRKERAALKERQDILDAMQNEVGEQIESESIKIERLRGYECKDDTCELFFRESTKSSCPDLDKKTIGKLEMCANDYFKTHFYKDGMMTAFHSESGLRTYVTYQGKNYKKKFSDSYEDYVIYGQRPSFFGAPTESNTMTVGNIIIHLEYVGLYEGRYFFKQNLFAILGISGNPIYNDKGEFVTIYTAATKSGRTNKISEQLYGSPNCILVTGPAFTKVKELDEMFEDIYHDPGPNPNGRDRGGEI